MSLTWNGARVKRRVRRAAISGINATMGAAIIHAKSEHGAGAHGSQRFESQTGELERSVRVVQGAKSEGRTVRGVWGSIGIAYARRIELGFQGKDSKGRVYSQRAYPFLMPAADAEYPKLARRIKRAFKRGL